MGDPDQFELDPVVLAEAAAAADSLSEEVRRDGDAVAWRSLEDGLRSYERETGGPADELLPQDATRLAFAGLDRAREYARKALCSHKEEVRVTVEMGIQGGSMALIPALFGLLALPMVAAPVVIAMAAVLMVRGLDGFCASASHP
jgi:hypothetical protein